MSDSYISIYIALLYKVHVLFVWSSSIFVCSFNKSSPVSSTERAEQCVEEDTLNSRNGEFIQY